MPDLRGIRRLGPGPQSFTRRQHQQQKPDGSCLTFQLKLGTDGEPQHFQQLQREPQHDYTSGEPSFRLKLNGPRYSEPSLKF